MPKIKFNWGTGITLFILLWVGGITGFVIFTFGHDIHLVEEDYYPKEEQYQEKIDQLSRSKSFEKDLKIEQTSDSVILHFPQEVTGKIISANVHFYRPSAPDLDRHDTLSVGVTSPAFSKNTLEQGNYTIKVEWVADSVSYYYTNDLYVRK